jgi:hypothetical protein
MITSVPEQPPAERRETAGDVVIHWAATVSVITVTAIAAVISYGHARELVTHYGVSGLAADTLPLTIDGLVATCSLVLVDCARHGRPAPWHAWALLVTGACAQVAANVAAGLSHGIVGAVIAGWPALVACGCFELLLHHRKHSTARATYAPEEPALPDLEAPAGPEVPAVPEIPAVPATPTQPTPPSSPELLRADADPAVARARELYRDGLAAGRVPPIRAIKRDLRVGTGRATTIQAALTAPAGETARAA